MFSRTKLILAGLALASLTALGTAAQAQPTPTTTQNPAAGNQTRRAGRAEQRGMRRFGRAPLGALRQLNLTDQQSQQVRAIMERNFNNTKALREELRTLGQKRFEGTLTPEEQARAKELHQQMARSMQGAMTEVQGILTAEQKAQLEALKKEGGPKRGRHDRRFGGPRQNQGTTNPPKP